MDAARGSGLVSGLFDWLRERHPRAQIARVDVEQQTHDGTAVTVVVVSSAKPGLLIGKDGATANALVAALEERFGGAADLQIVELRRPELEPQLVADHVVKSVGHGRAVDDVCAMAIENSLRAGARGVRVVVDDRPPFSSPAFDAGGDVVEAVCTGVIEAADDGVAGARLRVTVAIQR